MPVAWSQILDAFEFVSMSEEFGNAARVCRETGAVHTRSDWDEELEALPEDIDDAQKYVALPTPRDLDLGRRLVMSFAAERLGDRYDDIAAIFSRKGAYRRIQGLSHPRRRAGGLVRLRGGGEGKRAARMVRREQDRVD